MDMVDANRPEGTLRNIGGKVEDAVGGLTGDSSTRLRGKANEAAGAAQDMYGQAADGVRDFATEQPMMALLAAAGLGLMLGIVIARR
jgi:uncharacterized protein YjbJ (UPF0337 family)